jgi:hypothetical protein
MDQTTTASPDEDAWEGDREERAAVRDATLAGIAATLIEHSKMLRAILTLLTAVASKDGDYLGELLEAMIARPADQTAALPALSAGLTKLGYDLPLDLVPAIDDHLDIPRRVDGQND